MAKLFGQAHDNRMRELIAKYQDAKRADKEARRLPPDEQRAVIFRSRIAMHEAVDAFIAANTYLIQSRARRWTRPGSETDDLYQVGCLGIMSALDRVDLGRPNKVMTYVRHWIDRECADHVRESQGAFTLGRRRWQMVRALFAANEELMKQLRREPTDIEQRAKLGWTSEMYDNVVFDARSRVSFVVDRNHVGYRCSTRFDFRAEMDGEDGVPMAPERGGRELAVIQAFARLKDRQQAVLQARFGMAPFNREMTLVEVSQLLAISKARVHQIEHESLVALQAAAGLEGPIGSAAKPAPVFTPSAD
jgi:RNA polymerase sigma factor (sigma-70 family)